MSRNGSGTYTLPAGNPVGSNTTISSSWANTTLSDIAAELTNSMPRDGQAGPTGPYNWNAQNLTNVNNFGAVTATFTGLVTFGAAINEAKGADLPSAATVNIGAATGNYVNVTGTTTITAFDTVAAGIRRIVHFTGALTLTYNATSLILPGGLNITTRVDDVAVFVSEGSGNWRCISYQRADGTVLKSSSVVGSIRNGRMNVSTASATATFTADEVLVETALGGLTYQLANYSQAINLATTGAGGMDTGGAPVSGYVALYAIYNPSTNVRNILVTNATAGTANNVYGGANMPSGYTASALIGVWPTNGSGQFSPASQRDRKLNFAEIQVLSSTSVVSNTSLSLSAAVPANAIEIFGRYSIGNGSTTSTSIAFASDASGTGNTVYTWGLSNQTVTGFFQQLLNTAQTLYYTTTNSTGTSTFTVKITGYTF